MSVSHGLLLHGPWQLADGSEGGPWVHAQKPNRWSWKTWNFQLHHRCRDGWSGRSILLPGLGSLRRLCRQSCSRGRGFLGPARLSIASQSRDEVLESKLLLLKGQSLHERATSSSSSGKTGRSCFIAISSPRSGIWWL